MVELVVTIVVVGILAAVVLPRFDGRHGFEARGLRDETAAALRHAQKTAIAARRLVCVSFTADGLSARVAAAANAVNCAAGVDLPMPGGGTLVVRGKSGAVFSSYPVGGLTFTPLGSPNAAASIAVAGLPAALAITVEAQTGHVH